MVGQGGVGFGWVAVIIEGLLRLIITPLILLEFGLQALVKYILEIIDVYKVFRKICCDNAWFSNWSCRLYANLISCELWDQFSNS